MPLLSLFLPISLLFLLLLSPLYLSIVSALDYNMADLTSNFPSPFSTHNKVLGMLLSFNMGHVDPLTLIVNEYTAMCEGGKMHK